MTDWQHGIRNQLNLVVYASAWAREALAEGRTQDAIDALSRIDDAVAECSLMLGNWDQELHGEALGVPAPPLPGQLGTGQAG